MENLRSSTPIKRVENVLAWLMGIIFLIVGLINISSNLFSSVFFLLSGVILIKPTRSYLLRKTGIKIKRSIKLLVFVACLAIAGFSLNSDGDSKDSQDKVSVQDEINETPGSIEYGISQAIVSSLGFRTNMDKPTLRDVEKNGQTVSVRINSSENIGPKLQKSTMNKEAVDVFKAIFQTDPTAEVARVWSYLPVQDQYANLTEDVAISYSMSRELFQKINWTNYFYDDLPKLLELENQKDQNNFYREQIKFN